MPVSVNVGALQLQQPDFVDRLASLLAAHPGVKPSSLELEVLETSALQDVVQTSQVLNACHSIGVSFALDDFGTGYSSLTYLKRLPASILKIDQSFVSDMLEDPENLNILEGILGLGSAFHRQVIAEGVETRGTWIDAAAAGLRTRPGLRHCAADAGQRSARMGVCVAARSALGRGASGPLRQPDAALCLCGAPGLDCGL